MSEDTRLRSDEVRGIVREPARKSRAAEDRPVTESRTLTDDERVEMFRKQYEQGALPDLPLIPGYHVCWLTNNNPRDSIPMRLRMGYEPIRPEDIPGWDHTNIKTGEWAGYIGINEMLAFKLPLSLYTRYMAEAHHYAPLSEDEKLTSTVDFLKQQAASTGANVVEGDGVAALRAPAPKPRFDQDGNWLPASAA